MANKVQLMRLKGKATGAKTIPPGDRIYFSIQNEKTCPDGKAVFVDNNWSVGRAIDAIASECKMPNNNNVATAKKLRLFRKSDNVILTTDMSLKISDLIKDGVITNGITLNADYV